MGVQLEFTAVSLSAWLFLRSIAFHDRFAIAPGMGLFLGSLLSAFTPAWWSSVGLGAAIGLLYTAVSLIAIRFALRQAPRTFMMIVLGGMAVRMGVALIAVVLILYLLPVEQAAFIGSFFGVFILGMIAEVLYVRRAAPAGPRS